ncbi:hypothetical protein D0962_22760 [Leptolyngbyaceae cyanobacterium CCMR0082]|uniref:Uncharacterized protein n=1 Tax=Adonisia turfae CCMR0082 TaxID=2304604 RepID=A0A6M0SAQ1_9CYAN|nr:hypothetical protein [Adonisia turfae]NEZ65544.1 hypothetical protein [Adonisia turfae CCMR0082]
MSVTRKFTIWSPAAKLAGTPDLVITQSSGEFLTYEDLGQLRYEELTETGVLTLQDNAAEARLYTFQMGDSIEKTALLNYLRILQKRGDGAIPIQKGELRFRDEYYRFDTAEITGVNFRTAYGTPITVSTRSLSYYEAPCYLLIDGPWRSRLGMSTEGTEETSGETADFAILERINPIASDGITEQRLGTIRVSYGGFRVDFDQLDDPYIREPNKSIQINYSLSENPGISGIRLGTYKQQWPIQGAELTKEAALNLDSLLASWRQSGGNIILSDLTRKLAEPSPRTRAISTGSEDVSNGISRYYASFNVGQDGALAIREKAGDSTKRLISIIFKELGASA